MILFFYTEIAKYKCRTGPFRDRFCDAFDVDCHIAKVLPVCRPYIINHGRRRDNRANITAERYKKHILALDPKAENFPYGTGEWHWDVIPPCPRCHIPGSNLIVFNSPIQAKELVPGRTESKFWWTRWCKYYRIDFHRPYPNPYLRDNI